MSREVSFKNKKKLILNTKQNDFSLSSDEKWNSVQFTSVT